MKKFLLLFFLMIFSLGQSQNKILNSYFTSAANWTISGPGSVTGGQAVFTSTASGGNPWDNQLVQGNLSFTNAATYTLTFRASAASNRTMTMAIQNPGAWSDQFRVTNLALTTSMQVFTYTFNATSTFATAQIGFLLAGSGSTAAVYIDDVTLVPGTATQCTNFIQDGTETGVDCGGTCPNVCLINPTFNPFAVGPNFVGDAPYTVTATSDSPGAITYSSSNPAVATINVNSGLVTILTAGTTTISANQAATVAYNAGSTSALLTVTIAPPGAAPTPPARVATDVVSVYSDAYAVGVTSPAYGSSTAVTPGGNAARYYTGSNNGQMSFTTTNAAANMPFLHLDIYTTTANVAKVFVQVKGTNVGLLNTPNGVWTGLDIPASAVPGGFSNVNGEGILGFAGAGDFYVDNVYFYKYPDPTLTGFAVGPKLSTDPVFTITPPTSNNTNPAATFSYISGDPSVANIINGNQIQLTGLGGTSVITATQAAAGLFSSGSTTATLTVTAPNPPPTLTGFAVAPKLTGDANFTITPPTTNNSDPAATFSYSSSNTNVAVIVNGNEIQVKGTGTSTITALQAAGGSFSAGSTTASFVVSLGAAPTQPTRNAWDVVSVFASPLYTDVAGTNFNPDWGQAGGAPNVYPANMTTPSYGGDAVKQYQNSGTYQGTRLGSDINVSAINKLHVNIYSPTITSLRLFLIKTTDGSAENFITVPLTPGVWNNVDVTVNATTFPGLDLTKIREIKYDQFAGNSTLVIDNFYFWRDATLQPPTVGVFTVPAKLVGAANFTITPPTSNNTSPFTYTSSNTNVATIVNGNQIRVLGDGTSTITASQVSDGNFGPSTSTASFVVSYPAPVASPALAPRNPGTVVPFYTGGSTTSPYVSTFTVEQASWSLGGSQSNLSFSNGANNCAQVNNLGFFGFVRTGNVSFNVTTMSKLHIDIYLNASVSNLKIFLLTNGDQLKNSGPLAAGWNSLDINLSDFAGANLSNVFGFKFEKDGVPDPKIQIYLDNIYFYIPATVPVVTNFPSLTKTTSSAPFDLIQPTSTSPSTVWTYTSSNTAVATISGTKVTIKGAGTAIITANQAATVGFEAGSISTTLAVSLNTAAPTPPVRNAWDVISYYSDSYAVASTPTWGGSPNSDVSLAGNTTRLLGDYTVATVAFAPKNVSAMTTLHVDIYSTNQSPTYIWLNDVRYTANTPIGWTRLDIPLTSFPGVTLSAINLVRIENPTGAEVPRKTAYVDNIYFYRPATLQIPEITPSQCNQTLANIDDYVYANYVAGAQSFLWEVTELDGSNQPVGAPQTRQTYLRNLRISELPKFAYGKTYSIRVSVTVAGVPTPFNNPCKISTPLAPVKLINCAAVLTTLNTNLECNYVRYITPYFFHVTNNTLGYDYTFTNTNRVLVVKQLPGLLPGYTYNVQVSYRNKDNSISAEGGLCSFTTPAAVAKFADSNSAIGFDAFSYPNPFTNDFSINVISNVQDKVQISVYDMVGRLVDSRNSNVSDLQSLRVGNNYQAGVYNVVVSQGMNVKTLRVVKR